MAINQGVKFSLRIYDEKRENLEELINSLNSNFTTEIIEIRNKTKFRFMLMIEDLQQSSSIKELIMLLEANNYLYKLINLFVSFSSESDMTGFSFSQPMIDIISHTRCSVDISLIFIN